MNKRSEKQEPKTCFIVMPISDMEGYEIGHFKRVYDYIIKPACDAAGFVPIRADDIQTTNFIVIDILKRIISADMVVCDLSGRNPNVLYELGVRHAFNLPVVLIKDSNTSRIFDIQGLRDIEYDASLRIDAVESARKLLENTLKNTAQLGQPDINSIVQLLGVTAANLTKIEISPDTNLLLKAIGDIGERISRLEDFRMRTEHPVEHHLMQRPVKYLYVDKKGEVIRIGDKVRHIAHGEGEVTGFDKNVIIIEFGEKGSWTFHPEDTMKSLECINDEASSS